MVQLETVSKSFRSPGGAPVRALHEVSFTPDPGSLVAVVGPSGSGKSTLLLTAAGLSRPDSGRVFVAGTDLYSLSAAKRAALRRSTLGVVFQTFNLIPYLTCQENIALPARLAGHSSTSARAKAQLLLDRVGLSGRARHRPAQLSVGERQRVAIARSVVNDPQVVFADEPTGNLDQEAASNVIDLLAQIAADGRTIVMVTHDPAIARRAHRVVSLRQGQLVAENDLAWAWAVS